MKTAVVTGGSRGIGRAISLELAGAGARVVLTCQRDIERAEATAEEIRAAGGQATALVMDVLKPEEIKAMADRVGADGGGPWGLTGTTPMSHQGGWCLQGEGWCSQGEGWYSQGEGFRAEWVHHQSLLSRRR